MSTTKTAKKYFYGVGRRKEATARAKLYEGTNPINLVVNGKPAKEYFPSMYYQILENMLHNAGVSTGEVELFIRGGGVMAQAEAGRLAIAKSLLKTDEGYRPVLRMYNYLTTDIRKVLPKRSGLRKARKKEQWSKR